MRIERVSVDREGEFEGRAATVVWEDSDRPSFRLHFRVPSSLAWELPVRADPFVVACLLPAMRHRERRIWADGQVCAELLAGLETAAHYISYWYGPPERPALEVRTRPVEPPQGPGAAAALFLSGGVDSLASLRANRLRFPPSHDGYVRWGLIVHGFDIGYQGQDATTLNAFDRALTALAPIGEDAGVQLVPVFTNLRRLDEDVEFWVDQFHGAALASVAHALAARLWKVSIAGSADIADLAPWGSHPALDQNYSSAGLRVHHDLVAPSRLAKTRLLADWPAALAGLRVCPHVPSDRLNCGRCEKCLRTMAALLAIGVLDRTGAFVDRDVTPEQLLGLDIYSDYTALYYRELIAPLMEVGRSDLAFALGRKLRAFERRQRLKSWDVRCTGGRLARLHRRWLSAG